jgi:hypothetical protein
MGGSSIDLCCDEGPGAGGPHAVTFDSQGDHRGVSGCVVCALSSSIDKVDLSCTFAFFLRYINPVAGDGGFNPPCSFFHPKAINSEST